MSDVDLVERTLYDLSYKYFLGLNPEDEVINASTLSKFRLVRKSRKAGMKVESVIADRAYSGKDNLKLANQEDEEGNKNFKLVSRLNPSITEGFRKDNRGFVYNKDADMMQCPVGELSVRKAVTWKKYRNKPVTDLLL